MSERRRIREQATSGALDLLYVSPERLVVGDLVGLRLVTATSAALFAAFIAVFLGRRADLRLSLEEPADSVPVAPASVPGSAA